ncbi:MAG TPA: glucan 1,4-alpha-glucosidase [Verrucomicrobiae bacterium]|jgi:glucoamylase
MSTSSYNPAPGAPGIDPRWTSSAKSGVGTAISGKSRVWFTLSHGIFNEIYFPRIDQACIRDMGLIVTDGKDFFSEEKRHTEHTVEWLAEGVPAFKLVNTCEAGRYRIEKQIVTDPARDTVLQKVMFHAQKHALSEYQLHVLLAPHLENHGRGNTAWIGEFQGTPVLFARRNTCSLALACSAPLTKCSAGFVGSSDGWQDLKAHGKLTWEYTHAENGNVALVAKIDLAKPHEEFVLALGFGENPQLAAQNAVASLADGFDKAKNEYMAGWQEWRKSQTSPQNQPAQPGDFAQKSLAVLRTHESKDHPGAIIASLAIPWGFNKGDEDQGGYHLVWARDMVETAGGLLAAGAQADAQRVLYFLEKTQQPDGHWSQNMWLDGSPYWNGIQMDETALPILLVDLSRREKALTHATVTRFWPMVKKAAGYLARNGPVSSQDRWEEDPGYTPFTLAAEIAALLAAADLADLNQETAAANYLRELADIWNDSIERWIYMDASDWGQKFNVNGYYVRMASPPNNESDFQEPVDVKNVAQSEEIQLADHLVSPDALALVRFGLRAAADPRMRDTLKVLDGLLKIETPRGPTWHRYNGDGYGEHKDGSPFDGTGIGRGWPLLTGERAHYELAAGRAEISRQLLTAMESFANESGFISEQVWDAPDIAARELYCGQPSGSAMPLVWAHAEYLKLQRSLRDGRIFDLPPQTVERYLKKNTASPRVAWRYNHKLRQLPKGKILRIETLAPALVHWSADDWKTFQEVNTQETGLGIHWADLNTQQVPPGQQVKFTLYWPVAARWEGTDFAVAIGS